MTSEQQEAYRSLIETRGRLLGPNKIWVHNPKLAKAAGPLGAHFQPGNYSLTEREREIAVCIINSKWHSAFPTNAHERRGKEVGLPTDKVEATVLEVKLESAVVSLRADSPSRVRVLPHAGFAALDCGRRSGWEGQLEVADATCCLLQPVSTATASARSRSFLRGHLVGCFMRDMAVSR
jgi:hypothetical protein